MSALLIAVSMNIQIRMREAAQRDIEKSLVTIAETSEQALVSWVEEQKRTLQLFAENEEVRAHTEELLRTDRNHDDLLQSPAQLKLRDWFAPVLVTKKHLGFFIVAPDGVSIASARDTNIGSVNLLIRQENFLKTIASGKAFVSHPLRSDVALPDENGVLTEGLSSMFVGAPVFNKNAEVIAALLFRIAPRDDFNPILRRGRIGTSGETYAFNSSGNMISESRFPSQLAEVGLLDRIGSDYLNLPIRDPGSNLMKGPSTEEETGDWPLTYMADAATQKGSGHNLKGYRDYRGVPVVSVWLWNEDYNWGIATEIDVDEAYQALSSNLTIIRTATFVVVGLILTILMLSSISRRRVVASELRYRSLFSNTNDAIVIADPVSGRLLDANDRAFKELLYSRPDLLQLNILDLHPESASDEILENWQLSASQGDVIFETSVARRDGSTFDAEISVSLAVLEEGNVYQAFIRDVTKRKSLEEKLTHSQRMETVGTLAGGVAHDFNNLLTPIIGNAQLIAANIDKDSNLQAYTNRIITTGNRAATLVSQLMTLGSKSEPDMSSVKLPPVIEDAIKLIRTSIPHSISLTTDIDLDCAPITADASQIHQVIMNLCLNAAHAMKQDGGEMHVTLHPIEADDAILKMVDELKVGTYAKISVSDTGHGMNEPIRRQVFDPFFSTKEKGKGTGLGLSTVHNIITSHDGHITVYSEPDVGSTFNIYLPTAATDTPLNGVSINEKISGGNEHILIVDDDIENTIVMKDMLTQLGYTITSTNDGEEAFKAFVDNQSDIELLITDFAMPNMNGDVLVQKIRNISSDIPVVIMTGFGAALSSQSVRNLGIRKLLSKPFTREALDQAIREALEQDQ